MKIDKDLDKRHILAVKNMTEIALNTCLKLRPVLYKVVKLHKTC